MYYKLNLTPKRYLTDIANHKKDSKRDLHFNFILIGKMYIFTAEMKTNHLKINVKNWN